MFSKNNEKLDLSTYIRRLMKRQQRHYKFATKQYVNKQRFRLNQETISEISHCLNDIRIVVAIDHPLIEHIEKSGGFAFPRSQSVDDHLAQWPALAKTANNHFKAVVCLSKSDPSGRVVGGEDCPSIDDVLHGGQVLDAVQQQVKLWQGLIMDDGSGNSNHLVRLKLIDTGAGSKNKFELLKTILDAQKADDSTESQQDNENCNLKLIVRPDIEPMVKRRILIERALRKFEHLQSCSLPIHKFLLGAYNDERNHTTRGYLSSSSGSNYESIGTGTSNVSSLSASSSAAAVVSQSPMPGSKSIDAAGNKMASPISRDRLIDLNGMVELRDLQQSAVRQSIRKRISLIEGAAGTGKTLVAANLACQLSRLWKRKVLLCSPVQATVDRLATMIDNTDSDLKVVLLPASRVDLLEPHRTMRLARQRNKTHLAHSESNQTNTVVVGSSNTLQGAASREDTAATNAFWLDNHVDHAIYNRALSKFKALYNIRDQPPSHGAELLMWRRQRAELGELARRSLKKCSWWLRQKMERCVVKEADIVCCTIEQAGGWLLKGISFDALIIDDAQVSSELSCLVPLMLPGLRQVTLLSEMRLDIRMARSGGGKTTASSANGAKNVKNAALIGNSFDHHSDRVINNSRGTKINRQYDERRIRRKSSHGDQPSPHLAKQINLKSGSNKFVRDWYPSTVAYDSDCGKSDNLFERWLSIGLSTVALRYQYRLHETLAAFTNYHFYLKRLRNDPEINDQLTRRLLGRRVAKHQRMQDNDDSNDDDNDQDRLIIEADQAGGERQQHPSCFDWLPKPESPTALFDLKDCTKDSSVDHIVNSMAQCMFDIIDNLVNKENVSGTEITVIVNSNRLLRLLGLAAHGQRLADKRIHITTVDKFIGQEQEFVLLIGVRETALAQRKPADATTGSTSYKLGNFFGIDCDFLQNDSALNIALTRARLGLFIVTSLDLMIKESVSKSTTTSKKPDTPPPAEVDPAKQSDGPIADNNNSNTTTGKLKKLDQSICKSWIRLLHYYDNCGLVTRIDGRDEIKLI